MPVPRFPIAAGLAIVAAGGSPAWSIPVTPALSPAEMFILAQHAAAKGQSQLAERVLRALASNPSLPIRSEARFRLAHLLAAQGKLVRAATLLRSILDEIPTAQAVRLELARVQERLGDESGARRSLRQAQAGILPPDVARFVDRWSLALRARKGFGSSVEFAIAPDSNINRATTSPYLTTVLGNFELDRDARRRSGVGLAIRGQIFARTSPSEPVGVVVRLTTNADVYRQHRFNRVETAVSAGPEFRLGSTQLTVEATRSWYRADGKLYASAAGGNLDIHKPLGRRSQLQVGFGIKHVATAMNRLESGATATLSLSYERALSSRAGIVLGTAIQRRTARDPGYAARSGQISLAAYHEVGAATLIGALSVGRLTADEPLWIYPDKRRDTTMDASIGVQLRKVSLRGFSPFVRLNLLRNGSNIALYDTRATRTEFGLTRAF